MAENTTIEWADHTFNPWIGCTKVSAGCANCYAETLMDSRYGKAKCGPHGTRVKTSDANWRKPLAWNRASDQRAVWEDDVCVSVATPRRRVFCASLADVFEDWRGPILNHKGVPLSRVEGACEVVTTMDDLRRDLFRLIDATPNLDWLLLTKRPENVRSMWNLIGRDVIPDDECGVPIANPVHRKNVWLGTSVENQEQADRRIPELLKCRDLAPVLLLSVEPLLGPVDLAVPWEGEPEHPTLQVDGVIVGGESGRGARVCHVDWIRAVLSQCQAADVPCFVKQLGPAVQANYGDMDIAHPMMGWKHLRWVGEEQVCRPHDPKGGDWTEWPEDLRVRQLPEVSVEANR